MSNIGLGNAGANIGAIKKDDGKLRYDLVAPEGLEGLVRILTFGTIKYADRNWELGMKWSRVFAALCRHLWAFWRGEEMDPESGMSHLDHAACNIHFLQTYSKRRIGEDDRPTTKQKILSIQEEDKFIDSQLAIAKRALGYAEIASGVSGPPSDYVPCIRPCIDMRTTEIATDSPIDTEATPFPPNCSDSGFPNYKVKWAEYPKFPQRHHGPSLPPLRYNDNDSTGHK